MSNVEKNNGIKNYSKLQIGKIAPTYITQLVEELVEWLTANNSNI